MVARGTPMCGSNQCCQIWSDFSPNLATLNAARCCLGCQIVRGNLAKSGNTASNWLPTSITEVQQALRSRDVIQALTRIYRSFSLRSGVSRSSVASVLSLRGSVDLCMVLRSVFALYQKVPNVLSRVAVMMKPQVVFVLGGPGAGKGTQCSKITEVGRSARVNVTRVEMDGSL